MREGRREGGRVGPNQPVCVQEILAGIISGRLLENVQLVATLYMYNIGDYTHNEDRFSAGSRMTLALKTTRAFGQNIGESCLPLSWSIENPLVPLYS